MSALAHSMNALTERKFQTPVIHYEFSDVMDCLQSLVGEKAIDRKNYISSGQYKLDSHTGEFLGSDHCTLILSQNSYGNLMADYGGQRSETTVRPGMLTFAPFGVKQFYDFRGQTTNTFLAIDKRLFRKVLQIEPNLGSLDTMDAISDWTRPKLTKLIEEQHRVLMSGEMGWRIISESIALRMACEILSAFNGNEVKKAGAPALTANEIGRLTEFIDAEMENNFDLSELAMVLDRDPFGFSRSFKAAAGESPHQYVIQRRLMKAKNLLANTDTPLAEIAYACGFSNQPHMTSSFSKHYGISPGKWRRKVTA